MKVFYSRSLTVGYKGPSELLCLLRLGGLIEEGEPDLNLEN